MTTLTRPEPGRRPPNRRALIVDAATELFADRGYENVGMSDIAEAVAVGPSALYRHFRNKAGLLTASIAEVSAEVARVTRSAESVHAALQDLATYAVEHRLVGLLWQRESRQLPEELRAPLADDLRAVRDHLAAAVARERGTDLERARFLAVAALGAVFSPSFHHTKINRPAFEELLVAVAERVVAVDVPPSPPMVTAPAGLTPGSRREAIVAAAMRLFADRTYASVGVDEIAEAARMATSTVYLYFPSKADILWAALQRGTGYLQLTLDRALVTAPSQEHALRELVRIYARFAVAHPELVDALITEVRSLRPEEVVAITTAQREYVGEWVHLFRHLHPDVDAATATVTVQTALMVINDLARTPAFQLRPDAAEVAATLAASALGLRS